ncbi:MAG: 3-phosphoshikimate 1-carboxyvinyltransferase [Oscillospiraceae bacterium]|nr:3-phosphoshikimate 1-carboxyvinyltransferase [Oscillospiraceae bacterium]
MSSKPTVTMKVSPCEQGGLSGRVKAIPSKSVAHRALICATLSNIATSFESIAQIDCEVTSKDIEVTTLCMQAIEAALKKRKKNVTLHCGESGSTFRFLLPIIGALGLNAEFKLEGRLPERPLSPLYEEMVKHGCTLSPQGSKLFKCKGQLKSGHYIIDAGVSSQFISGLLFALPLLDGISTIRLYGKTESASYIDLTTAMIERFGIKVHFDGACFIMHGNQIYTAPSVEESEGAILPVTIEGDWSNGAFWLSAGAISNNPVTVIGLDLDSCQGDRAILNILEAFGAKIDIFDAKSSQNSKSSITVSKTADGLKGIEIDASDIPDLVPILSVVAAYSKGTTMIYNAGRLRIKESDRLAAMTEVLTTLGATVKETDDGLEIEGRKELTGGTLSSHNDHRIAMSAAIAATMCDGNVIIEDAAAVEKSYPHFFEDLRALGGICDEVAI